MKDYIIKIKFGEPNTQAETYTEEYPYDVFEFDTEKERDAFIQGVNAMASSILNDTEKERDAFIQGVNAMDGWSAFEILEEELWRSSSEQPKDEPPLQTGSPGSFDAKQLIARACYAIDSVHRMVMENESGEYYVRREDITRRSAFKGLTEVWSTREENWR